MTLQNEKFEEIVSRQLAAELEPQRGKALAAFRAQMTAEAAAPAAIPISRGGGRSKKMMALWAGAPSLLAACVAVVVTLHFVHRERNVSVTPEREVASTQAVQPSPTELPKNTGTIVFDGIVTRDVPGNILITNDHTAVRDVNHFELINGNQK